MFEWLQTAEPGAPDDSAFEPSSTQNQVPAETAPELAHKQQGPAGAAGVADDRRMQQLPELRQLITQGRYVEAAALVLQADPPSAVWHCTAAKQQGPASSTVAVHVDATDCSPSTEQHAAADLQHMRPAAAPGRLKQWQAFCSKLQAWSAKALQQACPDSSMSAVQRQQLKQAAAHQGPYKMSQTWWRLYPPSSSTQACQLAAAVFHLSSSKDQAWSSISQALWHGLALDLRTPDTRSRHATKTRSILRRDAAAAQQGGDSMASHGIDSGNSQSSSQQRQQYWSPHGAVKRLAELQERQSARVKELLATLPTSATLGVEMAEAGQALLPATYLQLVGQKLLGQAAVAMPVLLSLPDTPPDWILRSLFTKPFAEALRLALTDILSDPNGDTSPYIPHLQQQSHSRDFRRIYPSEASTAASQAAAGSPGLLAVGGSLQHAGNKALLGVLACVFRDVQEFEAGLLILLPDHPDNGSEPYAHNSNTNSLTSSTATMPRISHSDSHAPSAASEHSNTRQTTAAQHSAASGNGSCKPLLAQLLAKDLQDVVARCQRQLGELMMDSTKQMKLMTLQEELEQPLHELLLSASDVKADTWPQLAPAPAAPADKVGAASSSAVEAASPSAAAATSPGPSNDCNSTTDSNRYSIFGSGSLWQVDSTGTWELATSAGRGPGFSRPRRTESDSHRHGLVASSSARNSVEGVRPPGGQTDHQQHQQQHGNLYHSSLSFSMHSFSRSSVAGQGGASRAARRSVSSTGDVMQRQQQWREEYLHQAQQVTQSQAQLLMFVGAFLARRQQYPLLLQDLLVTALIGALTTAMQHAADLLGPSSYNQTSFNEEPTAYHCCCVSMVLCIKRRLLWLKEDWTPQHQQGLELLDDSIQQASVITSQLEQSLVDQLQFTFDWAVLASLQAQTWTSRKPLFNSKQPISSGDSNAATAAATAAPNPAVRLWHMLMQTWQYTMRRVLPAAMVVGVLSQVLQHSCRALSELYLSLQPSAAWLPTFQQDVAVIATTAWEFSQPLQVTIPPLQWPQQGIGLARASVAGGLHGMQRPLQGQLHPLAGGPGTPKGRSVVPVRSSAAGGVILEGQEEVRDNLQRNWHPEAVSLPEQLAVEVSGLCKQLVLKAAELSAGAAAVGPTSAVPKALPQPGPQQHTELGLSSSNIGSQLQEHPRGLAKAVKPPQIAVEDTTGSSTDTVWEWLGPELQLVLQSRLLGQNLPARRLLDVASHAAVGTDLDDVSADVWVQRGEALLAQQHAASRTS